MASETILALSGRSHKACVPPSGTNPSIERAEALGLHEFTAASPDGNLFRIFYDFAPRERAAAP